MSKLKTILSRLFWGREETRPDWILLLSAGVILVFGLIMLSSATAAFAYFKYGDSYFFIKRQFTGLFLGVLAFWFFSRVNYRSWKKYAFGLFVFSIFLLLLVFIPGLSATYGKARSWINIFGFSLQPSEIVKLTFLIYLAAWLESRQNIVSDLSKGTIPFLVSLGFISFLMLLQPDLGTLIIIALTAIIVYFVAGGSRKHIFVLFLAGILGIALLVQFQPYQLNRFKCLLDPSFSSRDVCYQVNQSLIAVGSGGIWGRGLGESRQKLLYLPEVSGDSIFPVVSEEIGFVSSSLLIGLFLLFFWRGVKISQAAPDRFGKLLAIGIVSWIVLQTIINIGGMINLAPMTGVPLPFISFGGSSLLATMAAVGILANISRQER